MKSLDGYFKNFTDKLAYIDLKDTNKYQDLKDFPLPLYLDDMKDGIRSGDMGKEINLSLILDAMLINIAIDRDFPYRKSYEKVLEKYLKDIGSYTADKALKVANADKLKAILIARSGYLVDPDNKYNAYIYARLLWPKAFEEESEYKELFVKDALEILQETLKKDDDFAISYYELGIIYSNLGEYIKARSFYKNALAKTDDETAKEEIRGKISEINDNAEIEEALYYIGKSNYNKAVEILIKLLHVTKRADAYYYLAVAYQNLGQYENSIMAFENSLDLNADFRELYNDYAISLYLNEEEIKALEIINMGLKKYPQDPRMTYNKIQINLKLGNLNQAKKDIEELLSYDDLSEEIKENLEILKSHYKL